jgi:CHAT domain-containing protein
MKSNSSNELRRGLVLAGAFAAVAILTSAPASAAVGNFPLGQSARSGAVCKAIAKDDDPAAQIPHAKAWTVECYGWEGTDLGHLYLFPRETPPQIWQTELAKRATCGTYAPVAIAGLSTVRNAACKATLSSTAYSVHIANTDDGVVIAEGFAPVEELLETGLRVVAGVADPPKSTEQQKSAIALETSSGAASLNAAANSARRAPGWLRTRAHVENHAWMFTDAERDFRALAIDQTLPASDRAAAELNWALNISNESRFDEAESHFLAVKTAIAGLHNPELDLLLLNYTALHELNRRHFAEARKAAEQTLAVLGHQLTTAQASDAPAGLNNLTIDATLASRLNQTSRPTGFRTVALSETQRLQLLKAQALYVLGCADIGIHNTQSARKNFDAALAELRGGRIGRSGMWLNALIVLQTARLDESSKGTAAAKAELSRMIADFQGQEHLAASPAEARLYLELARLEAASGDTDAAIRDYDAGFSLFRQSRGTLGYSTGEAAPYFDLLIAKAASDPANAGQYQSLFFDASQSIVSLSTARTVARLAARVGLGDSNAAAVARAFDDAQRQLTIKEARNKRAARDGSYTDVQRAADDAEIRTLTDQFNSLHQQLLAANPRYGQLASSTVTLAAVQNALHRGEIYVKTVLLGKSGYGIAITSTSVDIYAIALSRSGAEADVKALRKPFDAENTLPRFQVDLSYELFKKVFGPVAGKVAKAQRLIYEPDGALISLPAAVFVVDEESVRQFKTREAVFLKGKPVDLYQNVAWLAKNTLVSLSVSPAAFLETRALPRSQAKQLFAAFGAPTVVNPSDPRLFTLMGAGLREASGRCFSQRSGLANSLYANPMNDTAAGIQEIALRLGAAPQDVVLGSSFTDAGLLQRTDLSNYKIVFFGTHGLLPGDNSCLPEPALVTSLGVENSDGFLDASEILNLKLDADLVVLSACSTAGTGSASADRTGLVGSGEALGGLARDFIYAGGRGLVVSQWSVEAEATLLMMRTMFATSGVSQDEALRVAQIDLMVRREFSHPYYWAGFSLVGDGARAMPTK